jgi:hypothetical protein
MVFIRVEYTDTQQ